MRDYHFYNYGYTEPTGFRRIAIPFRRLLRRLLRPMFERQVDLCRQLDADIHTLSARQDRLHHQLEATSAFNCDYIAMVRRLAALEEHVEALLEREAIMESGNGARIAIEAAVLKLKESGNGGEKPARDLDRAC
jgi:hypothetical protein